MGQIASSYLLAMTRQIFMGKPCKFVLLLSTPSVFLAFYPILGTF